MSDPKVALFVNAWKAPFVARSESLAFSGGLVSPKTLANADSLKIGPEGALRFGKRKIAYPAESLAKWIVAQFSDRI